MCYLRGMSAKRRGPRSAIVPASARPVVPRAAYAGLVTGISDLLEHARRMNLPDKETLRQEILNTQRALEAHKAAKGREPRSNRRGNCGAIGSRQ